MIAVVIRPLTVGRATEGHIRLPDVPLVSVFMPVYNQAAFVAASIESVLRQDYPSLELVISDDASTDGTADIAADYARRYPDRVRLHVNTHNLGVSRNCNVLLGLCRGEYIAFTSGDDLFLPGKIAAQVDYLRAHPSCVLCYHDAEVFDSATDTVIFLWSEAYRPRRGGVRSVIRWGGFNCGVSNMVRRAAMPACGYREEVYISDWLMWVDTLAGGGEIHGIEGVWARYRRHAHNISGDLGRMQRQLPLALGLLESHYPEYLADINFCRSRLWTQWGMEQIRSGQRTAGWAWLRQGIRFGWTRISWWQWVLAKVARLAGGAWRARRRRSRP